MQPIKIKLTDYSTLKVIWNDKTESEISLIELRKNCPCAICASELENFDHSYKIYRGNEVEIADISIIGNYAVSIVWKDGHNTGMYEFQQLVMLANKEK